VEEGGRTKEAKGSREALKIVIHHHNNRRAVSELETQ